MTFQRSCLGSNNTEFDDDPEDPDYVEDQVEEFEGKSYRPPPWSCWTQFFMNIKYDQL